MRMDHPFILGFCQNVTFDTVFTIFFHFFRKSPLSYITVTFEACCVSPIQKWETPDYYYFRTELLFQNYNLIPKVYPRREAEAAKTRRRFHTEPPHRQAVWRFPSGMVLACLGRGRTSESWTQPNKMHECILQDCVLKVCVLNIHGHIKNQSLKKQSCAGRIIELVPTARWGIP